MSPVHSRYIEGWRGGIVLYCREEIEICGGKDVRSGSVVGDVGWDYYSHIIIIEEPRVESSRWVEEPIERRGGGGSNERDGDEGRTEGGEGGGAISFQSEETNSNTREE